MLNPWGGQSAPARCMNTLPFSRKVVVEGLDYLTKLRLLGET